jgi:tyrosine-specific transport protein
MLQYLSKGGGEQTMLRALNRLVGGILLVAGTCIGAGMLGFPVTTAAGGFVASSYFFVGIWALMTFTAFLMLEVTLYFKNDTNLISMAKHTLGKTGAAVAWVVYVFFFYALMTAYTSGGASIFTDMLSEIGFPLTEIEGTLLFLFTFSSILWMGHHVTDWANRFFMIGLLTAYGALLGLAVPEVNPAQLASGDSRYLWASVPLLVTAFGFHLLIPSLKTYLKQDEMALRLSIGLGSLLSLLVYLVWEYVILGLVPKESLIAMAQGGQPVTHLTAVLQSEFHKPWIALSVQFFGLFALLSSFIGVAWAIFDFFADGLHIPKVGKGKALLMLLTLGVPAFLSFLHPQGFLSALHYAGVFAAILLIGFPAIMAWKVRQSAASHTAYRVMGGTPALVLAIACGIGVIVLEGISKVQ